MKSIYKKISVGVLAAALLVGGSGALQGGQAFAASKKGQIIERYEINRSNRDIYHKIADKKDVEEGYSWIDAFDRSRHRLRVEFLVEDGKIEEAIEIRGGMGFKMPAKYEYDDGWDLRYAIRDGKIEKGKNHIVRVGSLYFQIRV